MPNTLAELFRQAHGEICLGAPVAGIGEAGDGYELASRASVAAKALVLAMPRRSLELLTRRAPLFGTSRT